VPIPTTDFPALLRTLLAHQIDFIVVGGVAAVLQGAPITTFDLDLVHSRKADNIVRLLSILQDLDAYYRGRGEQRLRPTSTHLESPGHQLLMTRFGALDLLGTIGTALSYDDLLPYAIELEAEGMRFKVLDLERIIEVKEQLGQEKDLSMLPLLRQTLREKRRAASASNEGNL
jgi:predicted nucleotidyltransferase